MASIFSMPSFWLLQRSFEESTELAETLTEDLGEELVLASLLAADRFDDRSEKKESHALITDPAAGAKKQVRPAGPFYHRKQTSISRTNPSDHPAAS